MIISPGLSFLLANGHPRSPTQLEEMKADYVCGVCDTVMMADSGDPGERMSRVVSGRCSGGGGQGGVSGSWLVWAGAGAK